MRFCCEILNINGVNCHEIGCNESWKDKKNDCKWCGQGFEPEQKGQKFCSDSCADIYHG